ncbi:hypothetical protein RF11_02863 [Thelohanellus kitauei]|uniref:Uncharacterized protein n=1 Tax=Thelohanellus kitauei TaxID=669202 RepID=A0A0C2IMZ3_THEKT|nr:hypothetical protein RF11_02863 [Thelohanellus kitauei]
MDGRLNSTNHRNAKIIYFVTHVLIYVCLIVIETLRMPPMKQPMMDDNFTNFVEKIDQKYDDDETLKLIIRIYDIRNIFTKIPFIANLCAYLYAITKHPKSKQFDMPLVALSINYINIQ